MNSVAIGNGESRLNINLSEFCHNFTTTGCNALYREFIPDHLICCDRRMVIESAPKVSIPVYTRKNWIQSFTKFKNVHLLPELPYSGNTRPDDPWHWGSGPYAVLLSAMMSSELVYLLGFDLYSDSDTVNNVYKGTQNYSTTESRPVDPRYWIYQNQKVFECFPHLTFTIFNQAEWKMPVEWNLENVKFQVI